MGRAQKHDRNLQFNIQKELCPRMGSKSSPFKSSHFLSIQENKKKSVCKKYGKRKRKGYFIHLCDLQQKQRQNNKMVPKLPNSPESSNMSFQGQKE